jgi:hypothetical protein
MPGIEKNEAHIRLMNSLWYVAKAVRNIIVVSVGALALGGLYGLSGLPLGNALRSFLGKLFSSDFSSCLILFSLIQLFISWYIRRSIKQYFHYMRVREIMFILEITHTVSRSTGINMFEGLGEDKNKQPAQLQGELSLTLHANVQSDCDSAAS